MNNQTVPESLAALNIQPELTDGSLITLNDGMILSISTGCGELIFTQVEGDGLNPEQLPPLCWGVEVK